MFLAKTSGFVLKGFGSAAVFAEGQSLATCQRVRDHWGLLEAQSSSAGMSGESTLQVVHLALSPGTARIPCPICHPIESCQQLKALSTGPLIFKANFFLIFFKGNCHG